MATLPKFKRIQREDIKGAPAWMDRVISVLNGFMDSVYNALNHRLTFQDNCAAYVYTFSIKAGASAAANTASFSLPGDFPKPQGCVVVAASIVATNYTPITSAVWVSWKIGTGQIVIDAITGLTSGSTYSITVLVF